VDIHETIAITLVLIGIAYEVLYDFNVGLSSCLYLAGFLLLLASDRLQI